MSNIHSEGRKEAIAEYLLSKEPLELVESCIAGIYSNEIQHIPTNSLTDVLEKDDVIVSDPMPNLYFTRDPGACVGNGVNVHHMSTPARRREALLLRYMMQYNRDFALENTPMWYDVHGKYSIEGGDVLVLSKDIVAIGYSERTTLAGIEDFAENR
jgi:arginine deiminase